MVFNNTSSIDPIDRLTIAEKSIAIFVYSALSLLAIGGNACVVYLVWKFQKLRSPTNYLIANLAVSDFFMAVTCIPFSYWPSIILLYWPFGYFMCKLINTSQVVTVIASAYTLVAISLDRFVAVMCPLKFSLKLTKTKALWSIGVIWIGSGIIALPLFIVLSTTSAGDNVQCAEKWTREASYRYSLVLMFIQLVIPFLIFIITYTGIGFKLWFSDVPGEGNAGITHERKETVKKMIPTMVIVTLIFAISWIPINLFNIWSSVKPEILSLKHILRVWWGCHLFSVLPSFVNPIVYFIRNKKFRNGFAYIFRRFPHVRYSAADLRTANSSIDMSNLMPVNLGRRISNESAHYDR